MEGVKNDEKGFFIVFFEMLDIIVRDMFRYNFGIFEYVNLKKIVFYDFGEIFFSVNCELSWDEFFKFFLEIIKRENVKRVVIDLFSFFELFVINFEGKKKELGCFVRKFCIMDIMMFFFFEMLSFEKYIDEYYFVDGVIVFYYFMCNY